MSTWPTAIRNNISTRPEQTGAIKGGHVGSREAYLWLNQAIISCSTAWRYSSAPNRWLGMNAWRRAVRRLATSALPERPTNLDMYAWKLKLSCKAVVNNGIIGRSQCYLFHGRSWSVPWLRQLLAAYNIYQ